MKNSMKKVLLLLLAVAQCIGFAGCNGKDETTDTDTSDTREVIEVGAADKSIAIACGYDTKTYDLAPLISNGRNLRATKDGYLLDGTKVDLEVGTNVFHVVYRVGSADKVCEIRIARREKYRVVLNSNGGSFVETRYVENGGTVDAVTPTRDRYSFMGWYNDEGEQVTLSDTPITADTTFTARWEGPNTFALPDKTPITYATSSAALNLVWKDYDDAFGLRPSEVFCTLQNLSTNASYTVKVTKTSAEFVDSAPTGASIARGEGNWTVKVTGLTDDYSFTQNELGDANYTATQSGTTVENTVKDYSAQHDDTAALKTENGRLYDLAGNIVVLKGVVTLNVGWQNFRNNTSVAALSRFKSEGVNCVRITMMLGEDTNGYFNLENRDRLVSLMKDAVDTATSLGLYCIVDWGVFMKGDNTKPTNNYLSNKQKDTEAYFMMMALEYFDNPYVIFEICNEPTVSESNKYDPWGDYVKPFEEAVIRSIRATGSKALVIAAPNMHARWLTTDNQAQGDDPIDNPFATEISHNVAYTFHCYAYTTTYDLEIANSTARVSYGWRLSDAIKSGLTIVMTEFSPATANIEAQSTGGTDADINEANKYLNVMLENDISYMLFRGISANDNSETSSQHMFIKGNVNAVNGGTWTYEMLSSSGKWFYDSALNSNGFIKKANFIVN